MTDETQSNEPAATLTEAEAALERLARTYERASSLNGRQTAWMAFIGAATPAAVLGLLAVIRELREQDARYRRRALALVKLGRRKYSAEKAWEQTTQEHTSFLWRLMDEAGIPREVAGEPRLTCHSVASRLKLTADTAADAARLRAQLAEAEAARAAVTGALSALGDMLDMVFDGWPHSAIGLEHLHDGDGIFVEPGYADKIRAANVAYRVAAAALTAAGPTESGSG